MVHMSLRASSKGRSSDGKWRGARIRPATSLPGSLLGRGGTALRSNASGSMVGPRKQFGSWRSYNNVTTLRENKTPIKGQHSNNTVVCTDKYICILFKESLPLAVISTAMSRYWFSTNPGIWDKVRLTLELCEVQLGSPPMHHPDLQIFCCISQIGCRKTSAKINHFNWKVNSDGFLCASHPVLQKHREQKQHWKSSLLITWNSLKSDKPLHRKMKKKQKILNSRWKIRLKPFAKEDVRQ